MEGCTRTYTLDLCYGLALRFVFKRPGLLCGPRLGGRITPYTRPSVYLSLSVSWQPNR